MIEKFKCQIGSENGKNLVISNSIFRDTPTMEFAKAASTRLKLYIVT
jgi:hypothetical protein